MLDAMGARVQDRRFIPYVQVHEFETLLFAELGALAQVAPDIVELRQFRALIQATQGAVPEEIDDGPSTAPSKRIEASTRGFRKTIHGLQAIQSIGLDRLRRACPRFNAWIAALEQL